MSVVGNVFTRSKLGIFAPMGWDMSCACDSRPNKVVTNINKDEMRFISL
jgi:hypothetical protein